MTGPAISIRNVSKTFRVYDGARAMLSELVFGGTRHRDFAALHDIDLSIAKGSVVGLIGSNGAGKSTLLKILTGILDPSSGSIQVNGRVSAILELGTGFNPDYTGRENIYLGGMCLGLSRKDVREREEEIIAFAELEKFIDQPFRTYSSGMQTRLTFSVAVSIEPDILIVDEALAVGDAKFQRKCFRKFEEFRARGCTILLVTHQTSIVTAICDRAVYLSAGRVVADGAPRDIVNLYLKDMFGSEANGISTPDSEHEVRYGSGEVTITGFGLLDSSGALAPLVQAGEMCRVFCDVSMNAEMVDDLSVGIAITTKEGIQLLAANPAMHRQAIPLLRRGTLCRVTLDIELNLGPGDYFVTFAARGLSAGKHYDRRVDALHFAVRGAEYLVSSLVDMKPIYSITIQEPSAHVGA